MKAFAALLASASWFFTSAGCSPTPGEAAAHRGSIFRPLARFVPPGKGGAEIVAVDALSRRLVYVDSRRHRIGIVDITFPEQPSLVRELEIHGVPTSVAVADHTAFVSVRLSRFTESEPPEVRPGALLTLDLDSGTIVSTIAIGEGPDSLAATTIDGMPTVVIAVENEPVLTDGEGRYVKGNRPGQSNDVSPPGYVEVVTLDDTQPVSRRIELDERRLRAARCLFPYDPQPEFVSLTRAGDMAAVTLQENNCVAVIDLSKLRAPRLHSVFALGRVTDRPGDVEDDGEIAFVDRYPSDVLAREPLSGMRMPDAIAWDASGTILYTADEGEPDFTGGRGFSAWSLEGDLLWDDGGTLESLAAERGHYRDEASNARGIEIEGLATAAFHGRELLFASAERAGFVAVYDISEPEAPEFLQLLSTDEGPEGIAPVPGINLLLAGNEGRGRTGGSVSIFALEESFVAAMAARLAIQ